MKRLSRCYRPLVYGLLLTAIALLFSDILLTNNERRCQKAQKQKPCFNKSSSLIEALNILSSANKTILLALVDLGAYEMTINFYETSIQKHGIENFLFLSSSSKMCDVLIAQDIPCLMYGDDFESSNSSSTYGSKDFIRKTNLRTYLILDVLKLKFNVLHTDVDVIFNSNPFLDLPCQDGSCDLAILWDNNNFNAGFLYIRSCPGTIAVYNNMKTRAEKTKDDDQVALNKALKQFKQNLTVVRLPENKYSCGKYFYEDTRRHHADQQPLNLSLPIVIHNNWIVSMEAKRYRFKEMLQWTFDENGYYSDKDRRYLTYENPIAWNTTRSVTKATNKLIWTMEQKALQNALMVGEILNRTVILPKFHCDKHNCSLLSFIKLRDFDRIFNNRYRENQFLKHPKVPLETSSSLSPMHLILATKEIYNTMFSDGLLVRVPHDISYGPTKEEILDWFGGVEAKVLRFSSLYGDFRHLQDLPFASFKAWKETFNAAVKAGSYRQF